MQKKGPLKGAERGVPVGPVDHFRVYQSFLEQMIA